ncbi:hypothetical protein [Aeromicrobium sp. HA]|uniref:hypothetical protein n=1 Tax=Aeromicrobium sp. HA TaxID=3009077 RepID=UPI0022B05C51|nr:hypothetical protein [Aeromicrobium sp. HA]
MSATDDRPGEDWTLHALYDLVPDAYELDLLEEARRPAGGHSRAEVAAALEDARREAIAALGHDVESAAEVDAPVPSPAQARFTVERLLGGVVVDGDPR